ncbi:L-glyceraldehyde 3-phosphate reductase [Pedobacter miscanthi]|uniref:L-glyceraldehyde 3-phosphate reductase n=1 Tax=Pedobacter miscanthi TaxID=2259170 RepID=A0A366L1V1_9SPHI|nr:L-glyceraldehyde 3-phosphate reductase [Pedobacter miscanthi]RBQ07881.1 L-glyceraldehyde 3-phosphate reductase [Pedobacter miscanthi]
MIKTPSQQRYESMQYRRCGNSGIKLPSISLGLWHNFGHVNQIEKAKQIITSAFDQGITHFDLANNYGPPPGSAEEVFGKILHSEFKDYRDEMIISSKAGYTMWDGPYGDWGSKKYLVSSLDQSLKRMGLDYVDIFYHHRPDPQTPLEETMATLSLLVRQGKALYVGISNYGPSETQDAISMLREMGTPCLIHQVKYSMLERSAEKGLLEVLEKERTGCIAFSPLAQGLLTDKYFNGIPAESRIANSGIFLKQSDLNQSNMRKAEQLNQLALSRDQKLSQMALSWLLKDQRVTSVLIGASSTQQIDEAVGAVKNSYFDNDELNRINQILDSNKNVAL